MTSHRAGTYSIPIPALTITLGRGGEQPWLGPLAAIVDTGADITFLPLSLVQRLKADPIGTGDLKSQWGEFHPVVFYFIEIELEGVRLAGVQIAADENNQEIILGRNLLNRLPLFLDGPQQRTVVLEDNSVRRLRRRWQQE